MKSTYFALHQKVQENDVKAFQKLFDLLWERLYVFAHSVLMNEEVAKDIVQEVWIDYWNRRKAIKNICIESYLFRAVRYRAYNYLRDSALNTVQIEVIETLTSESDVILQEDFESTEKKITNILKNLPHRCREIFTLSREEGMSNTDIATYFGISKRTVENQITFALKKIREGLLSFL